MRNAPFTLNLYLLEYKNLPDTEWFDAMPSSGDLVMMYLVAADLIEIQQWVRAHVVEPAEVDAACFYEAATFDTFT